MARVALAGRDCNILLVRHLPGGVSRGVVVVVGLQEEMMGLRIAFCRRFGGRERSGWRGLRRRIV